MVTDIERKAALLAMTTFQSNLRRIYARADGNYNADDFDWSIAQTIKQLERSDTVSETTSEPMPTEEPTPAEEPAAPAPDPEPTPEPSQPEE